MDFWQWVALSGLGILFLRVVLVGVNLWCSARQTRVINGHIGETARLIAAAEERTQGILARMNDRHAPRPRKG